MIITALRTIIIYLILIAGFRITGKRQLGELQPIELVVTLLLSDLAAVPMQETGIPLLNGLIPIAVLISLELILSAWMMKSGSLSRLISGNPIVIIHDGKLQQSALRKLRLTVDDLTESLRQQGVFDWHEVQYAIAETNGKISVFKFSEYQTAEKQDLSSAKQALAQVPLISDGNFVDWGLTFCNVSKKDVQRFLKKKHCPLKKALLLMGDKEHHYVLTVKEKPSL